MSGSECVSSGWRFSCAWNSGSSPVLFKMKGRGKASEGD